MSLGKTKTRDQTEGFRAQSAERKQAMQHFTVAALCGLLFCIRAPAHSTRYNIHSNGQTRVLGYATSVSTETLLNDTNDYAAVPTYLRLHESNALDRAAQAKADQMIAQNYWSIFARTALRRGTTFKRSAITTLSPVRSCLWFYHIRPNRRLG